MTLRDETEWTELIETGWNRLAPPVDAAALSKIILQTFGTSGKDVAPYGTGNAAQLIAERLVHDLSA